VCSDILLAPGLPCTVCDKTIWGEPHWIVDSPVCVPCYLDYWNEFDAALDVALHTNQPDDGVDF
jgi:hypothetical protein